LLSGLVGPGRSANPTQSVSVTSRWFASSSPWNTPIRSDQPAVEQTWAWIKELEGAIGQININQRAWTPTLLIARKSTPRGSVRLDNGWKLTDVPLSPWLKPSADSDAQAIVLDAARNREYDFFLLRGGHGNWSAHAGVVLRLDGSGWYDGTYCARRICGPWGARASSAALAGGLIRPTEVKQGVIPHALACAAPKHLIGPPVSPATTGDGTGGPGAMPMGSRLQLDPSVDIATLGLEPGEEMIARALQVYGAYIVESSSAFACYARNSSTLSPSAYPASWANGIRKDILWRMRVVAPPPRPKYDNRAVFGQPSR
jgi:hypothetical protein